MPGVPKVKIYLYAVVSALFLLIGSCKKDDENKATLAVLTTTDISDLTLNSARFGGNITSDGGSMIIARGVCWSFDITPTIVDNKTIDSTGIGSFTRVITGLKTNTTYYMRAYATNSLGTEYGNVLSFILWLNMPGPMATDIDGNSYNSVKIGNQIWMTENLKVTRYSTGNSIPNVVDDTTWVHLTTGAYFDNTTYGKLYNWYTVVDSSNLCPSGWHVPTDGEWTSLTNYLGGEDVAGSRLKETGTNHWKTPNIGATNESGFTALPGGSRLASDLFFHDGHGGAWWSTTKYNSDRAWYRSLFYSDFIVSRKYNSLKSGFSVRCVKD